PSDSASRYPHASASRSALVTSSVLPSAIRPRCKRSLPTRRRDSASWSAMPLAARLAPLTNNCALARAAAGRRQSAPAADAKTRLLTTGADAGIGAVVDEGGELTSRKAPGRRLTQLAIAQGAYRFLC